MYAYSLGPQIWNLCVKGSSGRVDSIFFPSNPVPRNMDWATMGWGCQNCICPLKYIENNHLGKKVRFFFCFFFAQKFYGKKSSYQALQCHKILYMVNACILI